MSIESDKELEMKGKKPKLSYLPLHAGEYRDLFCSYLSVVKEVIGLDYISDTESIKFPCITGLYSISNFMEAALVLEDGAKRYGEHNYYLVSLDYFLEALLRHVYLFAEGVFIDEESGHYHLAHILSNILIIKDKCNVAVPVPTASPTAAPTAAPPTNVWCNIELEDSTGEVNE